MIYDEIYLSIMTKILALAKVAAICLVIFILLRYREKTFQTFYYVIKDLYNRDPDVFRSYGVWLYCGLMGSGKTISMNERMLRFRKQYPNLWIVGNFESSLLDETFSSWEEMRDVQNPKGKKYGVLICFDEIHLTFASDKWKNAPDNLLETISMQRKNHKLVIASSQVFTRIDKKLREQSNYVIDCNTIFNRWTFQKAYTTEEYLKNAELADAGMQKRRVAWRYNFVQTDKIRNLYDTYELLNELVSKGKETIALSDLTKLLNNKD